MLTVIAKITAQAGKEEIAKQALLGLIPLLLQRKDVLIMYCTNLTKMLRFSIFTKTGKVKSI
jgi:hypothetical protein